MSDATEPRATTPFPAEGAASALLAGVDPLAGDWSEGLRGPVRSLGIEEPRLLLQGGLPQPGAPRHVSLPPIAPVAEVVEAPDAWGDPDDPLQSAPPLASSEPPSVIVTFTEPPDQARASPETTPPAASPAFLAAEPEPEVAPAFLPDVTPSSAAPAFLADALAASPLEDDGVVELGEDDAAEATAAEPPAAKASDPWTADAATYASDSAAWAGALGATPAADAPSAWSEPVESPAPAAAEPAWKDAPLPIPDPAVAAVGAWDQVTAAGPALSWQMPAAAVEAAPEPAVDEAWSSPPPAGEQVADWKAEAPPDDWQEVKRPDPVLAAPHAADWGTLNSGPDWSASAAEAAPAEEAWGAAPPAQAAQAWAWEAPAAAGEPSSWEVPAPVEPAAAWSAKGAPPAPSWHAAPVGASAMDQLDSEPPNIEPVPGAAQELFGSVPVGASLSDDESELPQDLGQPEELASPEEFLKPVDPSDDDADLLVPIEEDAPPPPPRRAQPLAAMQPVGVGALFVQGEHRVAIHTRGGRTRRGILQDVDLGKSQLSLIPQGGGAEEPVYHAEVKAIFFMLPPGEKPSHASGGKVRVTFADGRTIEGSRDGTEAKHGFFLVPSDAARTNTRRIYIAREATTDIKDG